MIRCREEGSEKRKSEGKREISQLGRCEQAALMEMKTLIMDYQIKAKDLLSLYVVFGDGLIPGDADPCEFLCVRLLTSNKRSTSGFAPISVASVLK